MDLIKQLGGYEAAKEKYQALSDSDMITIGPVEFSAKDYFEDELLEYRREHNILEINDKVFLAETGEEIQIVCEQHKELFYNLGFRHATDEEITAGHRL